jgi:hypothetical protein
VKKLHEGRPGSGWSSDVDERMSALVEAIVDDMIDQDMISTEDGDEASSYASEQLAAVILKIMEWQPDQFGIEPDE